MLPAMFTVGIHRMTQAAGYEGAKYDPPRDQPGDPRQVYGWAVRRSEEPEKDLAVTDVELLAPAGFTVSAEDIVDLADGQYAVIGDPQTMDHSPFRADLGVRVILRKC